MGQTDEREWDEENGSDYLMFSYDPLTDTVVYQLRHIDMNEPNEMECDMCGKQNNPRLRPGGSYMCAECWTVWNG